MHTVYPVVAEVASYKIHSDLHTLVSISLIFNFLGSFSETQAMLQQCLSFGLLNGWVYSIRVEKRRKFIRNSSSIVSLTVLNNKASWFSESIKISSPQIKSSEFYSEGEMCEIKHLVWWPNIFDHPYCHILMIGWYKNTLCVMLFGLVISSFRFSPCIIRFAGWKSVKRQHQ